MRHSVPRALEVVHRGVLHEIGCARSVKPRVLLDLIAEATNKEEVLAAFKHNGNKEKFFLVAKIAGAAGLSWVGGITAGAEFLKTAFLG